MVSGMGEWCQVRGVVLGKGEGVLNKEGVVLGKGEVVLGKGG